MVCVYAVAIVTRKEKDTVNTKNKSWQKQRAPTHTRRWPRFAIELVHQSQRFCLRARIQLPIATHKKGALCHYFNDDINNKLLLIIINVTISIQIVRNFMILAFPVVLSDSSFFYNWHHIMRLNFIHW